ncbi:MULTISPECIES: hypothetical protein [unclassified Agrobacterium]|uniref:hypothetical protein n=1 Tax=unclassified Agrobacterium TaxID=2632611 RepID=UPI001FCB9F1F|nr:MULTISPECIES: hypothetical protein [unclassified Agrobacterium]HWT64122.1 hypothetical protein [Ochrobactrum sp.]
MIHALRDVVAATTTIAAIAAEYQPTCFLKFSLKSRVNNFLSFGDKNDPIKETSYSVLGAHAVRRGKSIRTARLNRVFLVISVAVTLSPATHSDPRIIALLHNDYVVRAANTWKAYHCQHFELG